MVYAYRDRKVNKRLYRSLWIVRINAACKELGTTYSRFIKGLIDANIAVNRKMLADLAVTSPESFQVLVNQTVKSGSQVPAKEKPVRKKPAGEKAQ
jgi:large subunit ribosomal protein L20